MLSYFISYFKNLIIPNLILQFYEREVYLYYLFYGLGQKKAKGEYEMALNSVNFNNFSSQTAQRTQKAPQQPAFSGVPATHDMFAKNGKIVHDYVKIPLRKSIIGTGKLIAGNIIGVLGRVFVGVPSKAYSAACIMAGTLPKEELGGQTLRAVKKQAVRDAWELIDRGVQRDFYALAPNSGKATTKILKGIRKLTLG